MPYTEPTTFGCNEWKLAKTQSNSDGMNTGARARTHTHTRLHKPSSVTMTRKSGGRTARTVAARQGIRITTEIRKNQVFPSEFD